MYGSFAEIQGFFAEMYGIVVCGTFILHPTHPPWEPLDVSAAKEAYSSAEQPYISAKEPYISAKEPYILAKEP